MKISKKSQVGLIALSVLIGLSAFVFVNFSKEDCIVLKDDKDKVLMKIPLDETDFFEVEFRHSVNKGLVRERYRINQEEQAISLSTGWFENYGAGMMDTIGDDMVMTEDGDMLKIEFPEQSLPYVIYRSAGIADHKLNYHGREIRFFEKWPYQSIKISVEKLTIG